MASKHVNEPVVEGRRAETISARLGTCRTSYQMKIGTIVERLLLLSLLQRQN